MTKLERLMFAIGMKDEASGKVGKLQRTLTRMTGTVQRHFESIGTGALGAVGAAMSLQRMVAPAIDFNRALGEVASLGVAGDALNQLGASAKMFAMQYGGNASDVIRASYDIQSAISGLTGAELAAFTTASGVLAKATKADVATVTGYMGTMYGIFKNQADKLGKAAWVEQVTGQTALAVQMFKTTGSEMSAAFTSLGANAQAAGVRAAEQMAVLGTLQATMSGSEAGTKYKAFLAGIGNAGKTLGLSFTDGQGKMRGMIEILDKIRGKFGDTLSVAESDVLKKAFGSDEAVSLVKQLMGDTKGLAANITAIGQVNGMDKAKQMAAAMTDVWSRLGGVGNALAVTLGRAVLPALESIAGKAVGLLQLFDKWSAAFPGLTRWVGYGALGVVSLAGGMGLLAVATSVGKLALLGIGGPLKLVMGALGILTKITGLQTAAQWLLNSALLANPFFWVAGAAMGAAAVIGVAIGGIMDKWEAIKLAFRDGGWVAGLKAAVMAAIEPFKALGKAWDWLRDKLGFGPTGKANAAASVAMDMAASHATAMPEPPSGPTMLDAPRTLTDVPAGGLMKSYANTVNRTSDRRTTIGQVTINSQRPMTPAELDEWAALRAG